MRRLSEIRSKSATSSTQKSGLIALSGCISRSAAVTGCHRSQRADRSCSRRGPPPRSPCRRLPEGGGHRRNRPAPRVRGIVGVDPGRLVVAVAEPLLNRPQLSPRCRHLGAEGVAEIVKSDRAKPGPLVGSPFLGRIGLSNGPDVISRSLKPCPESGACAGRVMRPS